MLRFHSEVQRHTPSFIAKRNTFVILAKRTCPSPTKNFSSEFRSWPQCNCSRSVPAAASKQLCRVLCRRVVTHGHTRAGYVVLYVTHGHTRATPLGIRPTGLQKKQKAQTNKHAKAPASTPAAALLCFREIRGKSANKQAQQINAKQKARVLPCFCLL